ncbi:MAG: cytochrome c biogenesis protein ResB [Alphaproteobacteria bacterium]
MRRWLFAPATPAFFFWLLLWLMVLVVLGTVAQVNMGLHGAMATYFDAWIFWLGIVPLPAGNTTLAVLSYGLVVRMVRDRLSARTFGTYLLHAGALLLIVGGFITSLITTEGVMLLKEGTPSNRFAQPDLAVPGEMPPLQELPFTLTVTNFIKDDHPGTAMARSYTSELTVQDGTLTWPAVIRMNEPLRYKGYTFYQSSFMETESGDTSVIAVVHNRGRLLPYLAGFLMGLGMLWHMVLAMKGTRK